jgi:hypothetical protein
VANCVIVHVIKTIRVSSHVARHVSCQVEHHVSSQVASTSASRWHPRRHPGGIQVSSHVTSVNSNPWRFYFVTDSEPWVGLHGPWAAPWRFRYVTDCDVY